MTAVTIRVIGNPAQQGSKKLVPTKAGSRLIEDNDARKKTWRGDIGDAVARWREGAGHGVEPLQGALWAQLIFFLHRPPSVPKRRRYPEVQPDVDKLVRGVFDPLTILRVIVDDKLVVDCHALKRYAETCAVPPGVLIQLQPMDERPDR